MFFGSGFNRRRRRRTVGPLYGFALTWVLLSLLLPMYRIWAVLLGIGVSVFVALKLFQLLSKGIARTAADISSEYEDAKEKADERRANRRRERVRKEEERKAEQQAREEREAAEKKKAAQSAPKKSYGPEIDPIVEEGNRALSEMGRLYMSIQDPEIRQKINEIMRITDKIVQDAIEDPSDIPQIKKFMNYYLPTTIKLLNAYDRMSGQGIEGENIDRSMKSINEMLDAAIVAYKKRLDSLFEDQALDIETDIDVFNKMLAREGLSAEKDFKLGTSGGNG